MNAGNDLIRRRLTPPFRLIVNDVSTNCFRARLKELSGSPDFKIAAELGNDITFFHPVLLIIF